MSEDVVHFEKGRICHVVRDADGEPAIYQCPGEGCDVCAYYDTLPKRTVTVTRVDREAGILTVEVPRG